MSKKLHIKTWGCQMNEYDSSKMADLLDASNGYTLTEEPEEADVLLLLQQLGFVGVGAWRVVEILVAGA